MGNQKYRKICYAQLMKAGYDCPQLFFERRNGNEYSSYWGAGDKRMEVFYDRLMDKLTVFELAFVTL